MQSRSLAKAMAITPSTERHEAKSLHWAVIYEDHSRPIYYLCLRMLGDPAKAEDAAHDVFLKAFRSLDQFRGEASLRTWLYRIAVNHCRNLIQSWHHRNVSTTDDEATLDNTPSAAESPLRVLMNKELGQRIQRTLDALPAEYRLLLLLVAERDLSYEEIAGMTDQNADAVRGKLYRARRAFIAEFRKHE